MAYARAMSVREHPLRRLFASCLVVCLLAACGSGSGDDPELGDPGQQVGGELEGEIPDQAVDSDQTPTTDTADDGTTSSVPDSTEPSAPQVSVTQPVNLSADAVTYFVESGASELSPEQADALASLIEGAPHPSNGVYDTDAVANYFEQHRGDIPSETFWRFMWTVSAPGTVLREYLHAYLLGTHGPEDTDIQAPLARGEAFVEAWVTSKGRSEFTSYFGPNVGEEFAIAPQVGIQAVGILVRPNGSFLVPVVFQPVDSGQQPVGSNQFFAIEVGSDGQSVETVHDWTTAS